MMLSEGSGKIVCLSPKIDVVLVADPEQANQGRYDILLRLYVPDDNPEPTEVRLHPGSLTRDQATKRLLDIYTSIGEHFSGDPSPTQEDARATLRKVAGA